MKVVILVLLALAAFASAETAQSGSTCSLCEFVVQVTEGYVTSNKTEAEILKFLETACTQIPDPYGSQCSAIVKAKGPEIIEYIAKKENPEVVCEQLTLCPPPKPAPAPSPKPAPAPPKAESFA